MSTYSNKTTISWDQRVELTIPRDSSQSRAWDDFESGIRNAMESGKRAILLRAPVMVAADGIGRIRRLISSSLRPTNTLAATSNSPSAAMRWLVIDDLVLAKSTGADGVIFSSRPAQSSYSRAREVLGSKGFIGRLIDQSDSDTADTCSTEPGSEEIDLFVTAAPGCSLDADAAS
jgi:hypothetical protein